MILFFIDVAKALSVNKYHINCFSILFNRDRLFPYPEPLCAGVGGTSDGKATLAVDQVIKDE